MTAKDGAEIMENEQLRATLEALLFVSEEPQSAKRLAAAIPDIREDAVKETLGTMMQEYESERFGIQLVEIAGGYQLCTKSDNNIAINKLFERRRRRSLSKASLETLAIVAYKQPLTRAEVEIIRGVNCDGSLHSLLERRLIKIAGRREIAGRPFLYRTTKSFLQYFGLNSVKDLPKVEDITQGLGPLQADDQPEFWDELSEDSEAVGVAGAPEEARPEETSPTETD